MRSGLEADRVTGYYFPDDPGRVVGHCSDSGLGVCRGDHEGEPDTHIEGLEHLSVFDPAPERIAATEPSFLKMSSKNRIGSSNMACRRLSSN